MAREVERYREAFDGPPDRELHLGMEAEGLPFPVDGLMRKDSLYFHPVELSGTMPRMNWVTTGREVRWILRDPASGAENMEIDWSFRVGDVVKLRLRNLRHAAHAMQHPIHIHGQRFLVLSRDGRPAEELAWKDTTLLPVGTTATLLLEITNPGEWMIHCHVAEHLDT
ncbi:MAG: multicopper oxidase domain-containing protein, partial [Gemmatimonadota bacterium]